MRVAKLAYTAILMAGLTAPGALFGGPPSSEYDGSACCRSTCCQGRVCFPRHRLHSCCGHCCAAPQESREAPRERSRAAAIPSGPIVESYPAMRAMPAMMMMPVMSMPMAYGAVPETRSAPYQERSAEPTCSGSKDRLDDLDARVEALDLRMRTIQRAVELQTRLLEELKATGSLGGDKTPPATDSGKG